MEQQKKKRTAGICLTLAGGICWGLSGCFGQYLFQKKDITADWLVMVRLLLAGVLLVLMGFLLTKNDVADIGMICGGAVTVYFQFLDAAKPETTALISHILTLLQTNANSWLILAMRDGCI